MTTSREQVRALADGTRTAVEISESSGVCLTSVYVIAKREGLALRASPVAAAQVEWHPALIAELTRLWDAGLSISKIGIELGMSRNAVIGKVGRLGLPKRGSPIRQRPRGISIGRETKPQAVPTPTERAAATDGPGVSLLDRRHDECSWILGEPREFRCCGERVATGTAFCAHHHAIVYRRPSDIPKVLLLPGERKRRAA